MQKYTVYKTLMLVVPINQNFSLNLHKVYYQVIYICQIKKFLRNTLV